MKRASLLITFVLACAPPPGEGEGECEPVAPASSSDPYPRAHFAPAAGWMNDPCGLIETDEGTHLFYQHNPDALIWGNLHWGHAVTTDFVTYETRPAALEPSNEFGAPFSGTAILDEEDRAGLCGGGPCFILAFTHAGGADGSQKQSLAISDDLGATFTLFEGNPVVANPGIGDFRDPRVFFHEDTAEFVMVIGAGDRARVLTSTDLVDWTEVSQIGPFPDFPVGAYEVSDLFPLQDETGSERWVFKTDVLPGFAQQGETRIVIGDFDGAVFTAETSPARLEGGPDFYAAQRIARSDPPTWMGWLSSWAYALDQPTEPFRGQLTVPRALSLVGDRLAQRPVLGGLVDACPLTETPTTVGVTGDAFILEATVDPSEDATVAFFVSDDEEVLLGYDAAAGEVFVDRTQTGAISAGFSGRFTQAIAANEAFDLTVVVDRFSIELFADGGLSVITASVFPRSASTGVEVREAGGFDAFKLNRLTRPARSAP